VAFVEVRAVRPDGSDCDPGEVGEWVIRGPNVTSGYWRLPPDRDVDGWFHTGDVGSIDADGYLTFVDRASSALRIDGEIVYPATVEIAMYGMRGIADAAATEVDGRLVAAVVSEAPIDAEATMASLRGSLPPQSVPSEIRPVEAIPRNASGKVRRDELRALLTSGGHQGR
jgi:fatty-acyl-CoA synthase